MLAIIGLRAPREARALPNPAYQVAARSAVTQYVFLNVTNWVYPKATNWVNVTNYYTASISNAVINTLYLPPTKAWLTN